MTAADVATASYAAGASLFLLLTLLLLTAWRGRLQGGLLVLATGVTTVWCVAAIGYVRWSMPPFPVLQLLEILRDAVWLLFLLKVLGYARREARRAAGWLPAAALTIVVLCVTLTVVVIANADASYLQSPSAYLTRLPIIGYLLLAVAGLALVEQLYRNTRPEHRWAIKYFCFGVGGLFAYDLYLYSKALLFTQVDAELWIARGSIQALVVPLIAVSAARNPHWSLNVFVSRHVVFHSTALLGAGAYLVVMAMAGYYIRLYGGTWGGVLQAVFLFGALVVLGTLMLSGQFRARLKVFLGKHFYRNRYDYREEWLRFTQTLSTSERASALPQNIIHAIAGIVESPGGVLWVRDGTADFRPAAHVDVAFPEDAYEPADSDFVRFLEERRWIILVDEYEEDASIYDDIAFPDWLGRMREAWMVVPLIHGEDLLAFVVLRRSETKARLNWEDTDLLKTVGRLAASYLALWRATEALAEARQFEAFNRLSAYVVHDLKNLVAQLSLVVSNAKRHMHAPGFIEDVVDTVENATGKMNRLLGQLRKDSSAPADTKLVRLEDTLAAVTAARRCERPHPLLVQREDRASWVNADADRLAAVIEHLVQNAQEATSDSGEVRIELSQADGWAVVEIIDTGSGMDAEFVSERLFRPFDTTKGNAGMGVGVYQSREFVHTIGGRLEVDSRPGQGTTFRIQLPLVDERLADGGGKTLELAS